MLTIKIEEPATVGLLEKQINEIYDNSEASIKKLLFDFSTCPFIEITTLAFLISFITQRAIKNLITKIKLPFSKDVRDILRVWDFPNALKRASGIPFSRIVIEEDHKYFGEDFSLENMKYSQSIIYDKRLTRLLSKNFFSFNTYSIDSIIFSPKVAFDECRRWQDRLISSVLNNHLKGPDSYVSNRIIFEALTNTLRHPDAKIVQTSSFFQPVRDKRNNIRGHFTIIIWDDGISMIDTLRNALKAGKKIRSTQADEFFTKYLFVLKDSNGKKINEKTIGSDFSPDNNCSDELLLLTECFPGITCDIEGKNIINNNDGDVEVPKIFSRPGMGLYILVNAVVYIFGGEIAYRTKNIFINIKKAPKKTGKNYDYRVKAMNYSEYLPNFLGNMLTIRLPIFRSYAPTVKPKEIQRNEECSPVGL
ncbi:hypothetical protein [uncultured Desulfosarcina sp.]|uniref:hypothetical protein n=1 Tax=uncultured Desulfosarcina sp. TaxID=218289 RepID=UPI0029C68D4B|nr:hypothetical protein [uncultured Desulfosarcina sp.]